MAKPKSMLPNVVVDEAKRAHNCQHNAAHRLKQGDKRLRVRVQRAHEHFCAACALDIIRRDIGKLQGLADQLRGGGPTSG
jgi:hypothetical protein